MNRFKKIVFESCRLGAFSLGLCALPLPARAQTQKTTSISTTPSAAEKVRQRLRDALPRQSTVEDTAAFVALGEPPVDDPAALAAWFRVVKRVYGRDTIEANVANTLRGLKELLGITDSTARRVVVREAMAPQPIAPQRSGGAAAPVVPQVEVPRVGVDSSNVRPHVAVDSATLRVIRNDLDHVAQANRTPPTKRQVVTASFGVRASDGDDREGDSFPALVHELRSVLRRPDPKRSVLLAILDSGWPTRDDKNVSVALLDSLGAEARHLYGIDADLGEASVGMWQKPSNRHVEDIAAAIAPLREIDGGAVRVLYVPLVYAQEDAPVLRRFLLTHLLIERQNTRLRSTATPVCGGGSDDDEHDVSDEDAQRILIACLQREEHRLRTVPPEIDTLVEAVVARLTAPRPLDAFADSLDTTADVYNATRTLAEAWSHMRDGTTAFINASWTVRDVPPSVMTSSAWLDGRVTTVAAAGNTGSRLSRAARIDFAQRPFNVGGDFILVENRRRNDTAMCASSTLDPEQIKFPSMLAYGLGRVSRADACGSSFAAPRVAWILAIAEALRAETCGVASESRRRQRAVEASRRAAEPWRWPVLYLEQVLAESEMAVPCA